MNKGQLFYLSSTHSIVLQKIDYLLLLADIHGMWTGGRLCNYPGCDKEPKFQPLRANGWVWATKGVKIGSDPGGRWSPTGAMGSPQPDNFLGSRVSGFVVDKSSGSLIFGRVSTLSTSCLC